MGKTGIEWADSSLNFYTWDCTRVSPGCKHCYMMAMAAKFNRPLTGHPQWRGAKAYRELRNIESGAVVFVNSMSDTYHEAVPVAWIHAIHNAAAYLRPDVNFLLLTKRPERALALAPYLAWPQNLWIGTSVESREYLWRLDYLLNIPAAGHFISAEPLLDNLLELKPYLYPNGKRRGLGWVILGGESGPNRRSFDHEWAREVRDMCVKAKVPFLFKQGSALYPGQDRQLDKREWNESPFTILKHQVVEHQQGTFSPTVHHGFRDDADIHDEGQTDERLDAERVYNREVMARHQAILDRAAVGGRLESWEMRIAENRAAIEDEQRYALRIANGLPLRVNDFVGSRCAILGSSGMGKSNSVAALAEELAGKLPLTIVDLESEYWSLRDHYPFIVAGRGDHVDRIVGIDDAAKLAVEVLGDGKSVILDLMEFNPMERNEFLRIYFEALWELALRVRKPHTIILEEAHEFIPQQRASETLEIAKRIALRGRKRGLGMILASQRAAMVNKDVLTQANMLFLHLVQFPNDIRTYQSILPMKPGESEAMIKSLSVGQAIVRRAGKDGKQEAHVYTIRRRLTKDLGATPPLTQHQSSELMIPA